MSEDAPWVEKYRPDTLDEIVDQDIATKIADKMISLGLPTNLILVGPAGSGKSTLTRTIAKSMLGDRMATNFMEVNASDELRMNFLRTNVQKFIKQKSMNGRVKIVVFEEADNIPTVTQRALKRMMEASYLTCRYILPCNYISNIIEPIRSRCLVIRFKPVSQKGIHQVSKIILEKENLEIKDSLEKVSSLMKKLTMGDLRSSINLLQACDLDDPIKSMQALSGMISPIMMKAMNALLKRGKFENIVRKLNVMNNISPQRFLMQLEDHVVHDDAMSDEVRAIACRIIAEYDERLTLAGDQENQLIGLIAKLCLLIGGE